MLALDARIVMHDAEVPDTALPRLAIRPYPFQYVTQAKLKDGTPVTIRPIRPEDEPLMVKFHRILSPTSVYSRYFEFLQFEQRIAHERLARLSFIDYDREMAFVAEHKARGAGGREVIGVGRLIKLAGTNSAEFAVVVGDPWQNRGLGLMLLNLLVRFGRDERLGLISGEILSDNTAMKHVSARAGFRLRHPPGESVIRAELEL
jgi:acetyltransferase